MGLFACNPDIPAGLRPDTHHDATPGHLGPTGAAGVLQLHYIFTLLVLPKVNAPLPLIC